MDKHPEEWLRQADYDMETAEFMFSGERYFYKVDKSTVLDAVRFLERCLIESGLRLSKIVLFGSQAEGQANDGSVVDVAIMLLM